MASKLTKGTLAFLLVNLAGIVGFIFLNIHAIVIEQGDEGGPDPFGTFDFCWRYEVPVMEIFFMFNFIWLLLLLRKRNLNRKPALIAWAFSCAAWLATMCLSTGGATLIVLSLMACDKIFGPHLMR